MTRKRSRILMVNPGRNPRGRSRQIDPGQLVGRPEGKYTSMERMLQEKEEREQFESDALKHMKHARGHLLAPYEKGGRPYLASAAMALTFVPRQGYGTLGVDSSWRCYYDPEEVLYWPVEALAAVIEHELWHLLREHHRRAEHQGVDYFTGLVWNAAVDAEIHTDKGLLERIKKVPREGEPWSPEVLGFPADSKEVGETYYEELMRRVPPPPPPYQTPEYEYSPWGRAREIQKEWEENRRRIRMNWSATAPLYRAFYPWGTWEDPEGHWPPTHFPYGYGGGGDGEDGDGYGYGDGEDGDGEGYPGEPRPPEDPEDWTHHVDPKRGVSGSCADGLHRENELPPTDELVNRAEEARIRRSVARAVQGAKSRGIGVGNWVGEWADMELAPAKIDWRDLLRNAIEDAIQYHSGDITYTWSKLSRRQAASPDFVLPGTWSPIPEVAVVLDTSGSMFTAAYSPTSSAQAEEGAAYGTLLQEALVEIAELLEEHGQTVGVQIFVTDTAVRSAQRVFDIEDIDLIGGGGTDMSPGLNAATFAEPTPNIIIALTDGYTPWPEDRGLMEATFIIGIVGSTEAELAQVWPPPEWADEVIYIDE